MSADARAAAERLVTALRHLAMPAGEQVNYLRDLGVAPSADELALELDDAISGVPMRADVKAQISALGACLESMSGVEHSSL